MKKSLIVLLALVGWGLAQPALPGRIAFVTLQGQVATINPDGTGLQIISGGSGQHQFPAWSPDGARVAATGSDTEGGFVQLFRDAPGEGEEVYRSADEAPFYLYWSPDSERVGFLANRRGGGLGMHVADSSSSELLATGAPFYWQWTADSQQLFIHTGLTGATARLGFTRQDSDTLDDNLAFPGLFQAPGLSPSGAYLAYATVDAARGQRLIIESRSAVDTLKREATHEGFVSFSWSPVKDELAFISPERPSQTTFGPVRLLDAETGLLETLTENAAVAFFWSPDGRSIAYFSPPSSGGGALASGADVQRVSEQPALQRPVLLELNLIDVEAREERLLTTFAPSPVFVNQFLPFFDQYALSHRLWSPDSSALVLHTVNFESATVRLAVINLEGELRPIAEGDMGFWSP